MKNISTYCFKTILLFAFCLSISQSCKESIPEPLSIEGWWQQEGYGNIYQVTEDQIYVYNHCEVGCVLAEELPLEAIGNDYSLSTDALVLKDGINVYRFSRISNEQNLCSNIDKVKANDPLYNFDVLWNTFDENYSYFKERNTNWDELKNKYRSKLTSESTEVDLYKALIEMTDEIGDGHVGISAPDEIAEAVERTEKESNDGPGFLDFLALARKVANDNVEELNEYNKGIVHWGDIDDDILYLQVNAMMFLGEYDIPDSLEVLPYLQQYLTIGEATINANEKEVEGIKNLLNTIISKKDYKACILDTRFNGGGKDEAALEIMAHFTKNEYRVGEKKAMYKGKWMNAVEIRQHAAEHIIDGPLVVLNSHKTASASEIMNMSVLARPNTTIIGSNTEGIYSDMLDKVLPNGWEYSLSNELYLDHKGTNHEAVGIPPDINLNYSRDDLSFFNTIKDGLANGDDAINKAIEAINDKI